MKSLTISDRFGTLAERAKTTALIEKYWPSVPWAYEAPNWADITDDEIELVVAAICECDSEGN